MAAPPENTRARRYWPVAVRLMSCRAVSWLLKTVLSGWRNAGTFGMPQRSLTRVLALGAESRPGFQPVKRTDRLTGQAFSKRFTESGVALEAQHGHSIKGPLGLSR